MENKLTSRIRVPTIQYGYIDVDFQGTPEEIIAEHNRLVAMYTGGFGVTQKEFNDALDQYLDSGTGNTELFLKMDKDQQRVFQEIKKSIKRKEAKN